MIRILALVSGLAGAVALSQFPEFSQQYLQRLSGAVQELRLVVGGFDVAAKAAGLSREEALEELGQSGFGGELGQNLAVSIQRFDRLDGDYQALKAANPLERMAQPWNMADPQIIAQTWEEFRPAVPVTADGLIAAGIGFGVGWLGLSLILRLLSAPFRKRPVRRGRSA